MNNTTTSVSEFATLKSRLKATWMSGDFDKIAKIIAAGGEEFIARLNLAPGARVLDIACGTGNLSFPAARAGAIVTGIDIAPNLLETARARAQAEAIPVQFDEGDAEDLPYATAAFDEVSDHVRRDVRSAASSRRIGDGACLPSRRQSGDGELDAGGLYRPAF